MEKFKEPKAVWLGKIKGNIVDVGEYDGYYDVGTRKRDWGEYGFGNSLLSGPFCGAIFERVTGTRLERGELVKVEITVTRAQK